MVTSSAVPAMPQEATVPHPQKKVDATKKQIPDCVIRGSRLSRSVAGKYDTTVLLSHAEGQSFLTGFVLAEGVKRQIVAHINPRQPDRQTGEIKPNFLVLSELASKPGEADRWSEVGYGNAINRRSDGKTVYFDELLFKIGEETLSARTTAKCSGELSRSLGFENARMSRPKLPKPTRGDDHVPPAQAPSQSTGQI